MESLFYDLDTILILVLNYGCFPIMWLYMIGGILNFLLSNRVLYLPHLLSRILMKRVYFLFC